MPTMGVELLLRPVVSGADLDAWARLKSAIVPNEPVTAEQIHATEEEGRLLLLAEVDGNLAGCGIAARSHFAGRGFVAPRVLPDFRRQGVGTALLLALTDHIRSLGREELISFRCRALSRSTSTSGCATRRHGREARLSHSSRASSSATRGCWSTPTAPPWPSTG